MYLQETDGVLEGNLIFTLRPSRADKAENYNLVLLALVFVHRSPDELQQEKRSGVSKVGEINSELTE